MYSVINIGSHARLTLVVKLYAKNKTLKPLGSCMKNACYIVLNRY